MPQSLQSWLPTLLFALLIGFVFYRRFRKTFGPQPLEPKRMMMRMVVLGGIAVVFLVGGAHVPMFIAAGTGLVGGLALAWLGLLHTKIENTASGTIYTPNGWIGLGVTSLFLARLVARIFTVVEQGPRMPHQPGSSPFATFQRSPFTVAVYFLLAAYYIAYYAGVLRKARALEGSPATTVTR